MDFSIATCLSVQGVDSGILLGRISELQDLYVFAESWCGRIHSSIADLDWSIYTLSVYRSRALSVGWETKPHPDLPAQLGMWFVLNIYMNCCPRETTNWHIYIYINCLYLSWRFRFATRRRYDSQYVPYVQYRIVPYSAQSAVRYVPYVHYVLSVQCVNHVQSVHMYKCTCT